MSPLYLGLIGFVSLLVLLAAGMPIAFAAALVGFVGLWVLGGMNIALLYIGTAPYAEVAYYTFSVLPLFIILGHFFHYGGFARDIFWTARQWVGKVPGGLAVATTIGGAAFGAASGSSVAASAVLGKICIPEMEKYGYDSSVATGTVASCANLASMIPPSALMVIYGILTEASIAKLFIAGIIPGLMLTVLFAGMIIVRASRSPQLAPAVKEPISWKDRFVSLKGTWGVLTMILVIIGGLYSGFFTPTEAGAVGAFWGFLLCVIMRRLSWADLREALLDAGKTTSFVFFIVACVMIFTRFLSFGRVAVEMADTLANMPVPPIVIIIGMLAVYFILGMFFDAASLLILTLPVFFPTVQALGYDPIWFGVVVVLMAEIGLITPPVGLNCYVIKGVAPHIPLETVFKGIFPFLLMNLVALTLLLSFHQIALFLPNSMKQ